MKKAWYSDYQKWSKFAVLEPLLICFKFRFFFKSVKKIESDQKYVCVCRPYLILLTHLFSINVQTMECRIYFSLVIRCRKVWHRKCDLKNTKALLRYVPTFSLIIFSRSWINLYVTPSFELRILFFDTHSSVQHWQS